MHIPGPGRGISDSPVHELPLRVVVAGDPGRAAAGLPGVALPCVTAGLAGPGDRVGSPELLAAVAVKRRDEAAHPELSAGAANQYLAIHDERLKREVFALLVLI